MSKRYMDFVPVKNADRKAAVASGAPRRTNVAEGSVASTMVVRTKTTRVVASTKPSVMMPESTATPRTRMVRRDVSRRTAVQKSVSQQPKMQRSVMQRPEMQQPIAYSTNTEYVDYQGGFALNNGAKLGEVEELSPVFVNTDVPKRPLGDGTERKVTQPAAKNEAKEAKSKRLVGRFRNKTSKKAAKDTSSASVGRSTTQKKDTFVAPKPAFINQDKVAKRPLSKNVYQKKVVATNEKTNKGPVAIIVKPEKESKAGLIVTIILTIILGAVAGTVAFLLLPK